MLNTYTKSIDQDTKTLKKTQTQSMKWNKLKTKIHETFKKIKLKSNILFYKILTNN